MSTPYSIGLGYPPPPVLPRRWKHHFISSPNTLTGAGVIQRTCLLRAHYNPPEHMRGNTKTSTPYPVGKEPPPLLRTKKNVIHASNTPPHGLLEGVVICFRLLKPSSAVYVAVCDPILTKVVSTHLIRCRGVHCPCATLIQLTGTPRFWQLQHIHCHYPVQWRVIFQFSNSNSDSPVDV